MAHLASEQVARYLDKPAIHEQWEGDYRTPANEAFYELALEALVRTLQPPPDALILDAGCGPGFHAMRLARRGFRVVATDFSTSALEQAAANIAAHGLEARISLQRESLLELSFPDGHFLYVLCWGVLMHIPDVDRALAELARVLGPGGKLLVSESNCRSLQALLFRWLKRVLGREKAEVVRTPAGIESWVTRESGKLVTRETDVPWLIARAAAHGLKLQERRAGQFTEAYTRARSRLGKGLIHAFNCFWFRFIRRPGPAFGNLLIFEKAS
jgi:ubiquinone/menaquinone biosynthesis C-methylase UbiE